MKTDLAKLNELLETLLINKKMKKDLHCFNNTILDAYLNNVLTNTEMIEIMSKANEKKS